ncbi:hypothetical protein GGS23DRAFT_563220, partial [Durotheca rogersii]|uniref:uncharacterized protein n=1 Tax=Durotheca rogersii TaxID=419775 RepID=UPI002220975A
MTLLKMRCRAWVCFRPPPFDFSFRLFALLSLVPFGECREDLLVGRISQPSTCLVVYNDTGIRSPRMTESLGISCQGSRAEIT